ncbi:MAG: class I SAM-dependent methyltransferase [Halobacteria archaeon]
MLQIPHASDSPWKNLYFRTFGYPHIGDHLRAEAMFDLVDWPPGALILDAGCGQGLFSYEMLKRGYRVVMTDWLGEAKPETLRGMARAFRKGRAPFRFIGSDLRRLPFRSDTFDGVLCSDVLEHIPEDEAALAELVRVVKPGGALVISTPAAGIHKGRFKGVFRWLVARTPVRHLPFWDLVYLYPGSMMRSKGHLREYTPALWKEKAERAGLRFEEFRWEFKVFGSFALEVAHSFKPLHLPGPAQALYFVLVKPWTALDRFLPARGTGVAFRARKSASGVGGSRF